MKQSIAGPIRVGDKTIGDGHPIFIMADLGLTNSGDSATTFQLIDLAAEMGADAVKFQMINPDVLLGDKTVEYTYPTLHDGPKTENMYEMFCKLNYDEAQWAEIARYAWSKDLEFVCTAHTIEAVPILEEIGVRIHKICTWSVTHKRLVQEIGKTGRPLMLDSGMFTTSTMARTLDWHVEAGGRGAILLHDFHTTDRAQMNFNAIPYMKQYFGQPVGYTPQGRDTDMDFMSIGLGVNVLEKRLTLDRGTPENGHIKALEPDEFASWIERVKQLEETLGTFSVLPTDDDRKYSKIFFKSLYLKRDVRKGETIDNESLAARRPGDGIPASDVDLVCGRKATRDLVGEHKLSWQDIE